MGRNSNGGLLVAASLALCGMAASAAEPVTGKDGVMAVANVRVVNAPIADTGAKSPTQAGMRAFKDEDTGELRAPTAAEAQDLEAQAAGTQSRQLRVAGRTTFRIAGAGIGAALDESHMQNTVMVRQPDGSLAEICIQGEHKAAEVVRQGPAARVARQQGDKHDH